MTTLRTITLAALAAAAAMAQMQSNTEKKLDCREGRYGSRRTPL